MADYIFQAHIALDPATATLVKNTVGEVYAPDTDVPLLVRDLNGNEKATVSVGELALTEPFIATDQVEVIWRSGSYAVPMFAARSAYDEVAALASDAATSSQQSALDAAEVAARTMQLRGNAETGISYWGTFTAAEAPTAADGVALGDQGTMLP